MSLLSTPVLGGDATLQQDEEHDEPRQPSRLGIFVRRYSRKPGAMLGLIVLVALTILAIFAPSFTPKVSFVTFAFGLEGYNAYGPTFDSFPARIFGFTAPVTGSGLPHSVFIDVMLGARITLAVGICCALIVIIIGTTLGSISGYFGGWVDSLIMRFTDLLLALPFLPLTIGIILTIGQRLSIPATILLFGLIGWADMARLVRANFMTLRERDFVDAAHAVGVSNWRIIFRHLLPHVFPVIIVAAIVSATQFILAEATIEFIHLNQLNTTSLGGSISYAQGYATSLWWWVTFPGLCLLVIVLCFNLVGEGMREALEVHDRSR